MLTKITFYETYIFQKTNQENGSFTFLQISFIRLNRRFPDSSICFYIQSVGIWCFWLKYMKKIHSYTQIHSQKGSILGVF